MSERLYQLIGQQALRIAALETEVARLKGHETSPADNEDIDPMQAARDQNPSASDVGETIYQQLALQHAQLQLQHARCEERIAKSNRRYAQAKDKIMEWHAYVHQQVSRKRGRGFVVHEDHEQGRAEAASPNEDTAALAQLSERICTAEDLPITPLSDLRAERTYANDENVPPPAEPLRTSSGQHRSSHQTVQFGSSQSTVLEQDVADESVDTKSIKHAVDEDETVAFTHVKSKRRRVDKCQPTRVKAEPGTSQQPVPLSSDDRKDQVTQHGMQNRSELSDLDALQSTPKKPTADQQTRQPAHLRSLPLKDMKLNSFKPNPKFEGPYLRFVDPNIDMTKRRCPPGCKRVECCGNKMRKMLELGGLQVTAKTDDEVLREYLGPNWRELMASYGASRRKEIILQAHANSFASTTHTRKTRSDRPSTPPGFWRMDMPSTQEIKEEDVRIEEMERRTIEERWHEARRANGRWMFRDES